MPKEGSTKNVYKMPQQRDRVIIRKSASQLTPRNKKLLQQLGYFIL